MAFASNCPAGCPPEDAEEATGDVLRFVKNDPPTKSDLQTYADLGKSVGDPCGECGLSVLRRIEDVPVARKAMPWFKKRLVAKATLGGEDGRVKQSGAHKFHFDLWVDATKIEGLHLRFGVIAA